MENQKIYATKTTPKCYQMLIIATIMELTVKFNNFSKTYLLLLIILNYLK
jgi:hypothetical protein